MADLAYREVYSMNQVEARKLLIQTFHETSSLSQTARRWDTYRLVMRKWLRRFQRGGEKGLQNKSRRPHHSPRQTPSQVEQLVLAARFLRPLQGALRRYPEGQKQYNGRVERSHRADDE